MIPLTYAPDPAGWLLLAGSHRILAVDTSDAAVTTHWDALALDVRAILDTLTANGLSATPSFALITTDSGTTRVIVRGRVAVTLETPDGERVIDGSGVTTWTEQVLTGSFVSLSIEGATAEGTLPLESGAVRAIAAAAAEVIDDATRIVPRRTRAPRTPAPAQASADTEVTEVTLMPADDAVDAASSPRTEPIDVAEPAEPNRAAEPPRSPEPDSADDGYDYLFGATVYRDVASAAVITPEPEADPTSTSDGADSAHASTASAAELGEHDGHTIVTDSIRSKLRNRTRHTPETAAAPDATSGLSVTLPSGAREPLTQPLIIGRSPSASKVSGGALPRLVPLTGDKDISRNHVQVALEGGAAVVTDLHSRNGTQVILPGRAPQTLRAGEPTTVIVGTVIDLGGGVTLTVEEESR